MERELERLDRSECARLLLAERLGRLATAAGGDADIHPLNYVWREDAIWFRTAPGDKLLELTVAPAVAFEIDGVVGDLAYSVVVKGRAEAVEHGVDIERAESFGLEPWAPTLTYRWVRILPREITGVRFVRGEPPERF